MQPAAVVEPFDELHDLTPGLVPGRERPVVNQFGFQFPEERLGHRVIKTDPGTAARLDDPVPGERGGELSGRILGGFNWSSQRLDHGGVGGQTSGVDEGVDRPVPDEIARGAVTSS
jgi:hypothetical protein